MALFGIKEEALSLELTTAMTQIEAVPFFFIILYLIYTTSKLDVFDATESATPLLYGSVFASLLAGVLFLSFFDDWGFNHIVLSLEFGIGIVLGLLHPVNALCFFVANQFLRPWEVMEPNDLMFAMPRAIGVFAITSWALHDLKRRGFKIVWNQSCVLLLLFGVWLFLTTFKSPDPDMAQTTFFDGTTRNLAVFFLVLNMIRSKWQLEAVIYTLVLSVSGFAALAVYYAVNHPETTAETGRLSSVSMMGNSNDLAAVMVMVLPILMVRMLRGGVRAPLLKQVVLGLMGVLFLGVIWWSKSRGALLAVIVEVAFFVLLSVRSRKVAIGFGTLMLLSFFPLISLFNRSAADVSESSTSRSLYWKTAVMMALKNPLFGVGFTGYPANFERYAPEVPLEWGNRTAHSSWFLVLGETGFIGLFLYVVLFATVFFAAWKIRKELPEILLVLVGYLMAITFLSHSYLIYPYFLMGFVLAAERVYRKPVVDL